MEFTAKYLGTRALSASTSRSIKLVKPGELDRVPPGYWAAIIDGKVVAWAKSLQELLMIMESKGYKKGEYAVVKVPPDELLVAVAG